MTDTATRKHSAGPDLQGDPISSNAGRIWAGISRILIGFVFLWAFLDKNFGLGFATTSDKAWNFGTGEGNPTAGFLTFGTNPEGFLADFFTGLAPDSPNGFVNWLFMAALLGAGIALILGVFMRFATIGGAVLLVLMYLAEAPWAKVTGEDGSIIASNNPLIDDHIVYAAVLLMLLFVKGGRYLGLGRVWETKVPAALE
jgi:thiosulfate dehydrogenase [quinone] large subunit